MEVEPNEEEVVEEEDSGVEQIEDEEDEVEGTILRKCPKHRKGKTTLQEIVRYEKKVKINPMRS